MHLVLSMCYPIKHDSEPAALWAFVMTDAQRCNRAVSWLCFSLIDTGIIWCLAEEIEMISVSQAMGSVRNSGMCIVKPLRVHDMFVLLLFIQAAEAGAAIRALASMFAPLQLFSMKSLIANCTVNRPFHEQLRGLVFVPQGSKNNVMPDRQARMSRKVYHLF